MPVAAHPLVHRCAGCRVAGRDVLAPSPATVAGHVDALARAFTVRVVVVEEIAVRHVFRMHPSCTPKRRVHHERAGRREVALRSTVGPLRAPLIDDVQDVVLERAPSGGPVGYGRAVGDVGDVVAGVVVIVVVIVIVIVIVVVAGIVVVVAGIIVVVPIVVIAIVIVIVIDAIIVIIIIVIIAPVRGRSIVWVSSIT